MTRENPFRCIYIYTPQAGFINQSLQESVKLDRPTNERGLTHKWKGVDPQMKGVGYFLGRLAGAEDDLDRISSPQIARSQEFAKRNPSIRATGSGQIIFIDYISSWLVLNPPFGAHLLFILGKMIIRCSCACHYTSANVNSQGQLVTDIISSAPSEVFRCFPSSTPQVFFVRWQPAAKDPKFVQTVEYPPEV